MPALLRTFLVSTVLGAAVVLAGAGWSKTHDARAVTAPPIRRLAQDVDVSAQLDPAQMSVLARKYVRVVDLRPDGEAAGQSSAADMAGAAAAHGLAFSYVPVPHGDIPASAVTSLAQALNQDNGRVLLYCRSGRRAARTWALVEAARPGGMAADRILESVQVAGQDASDLAPRIQAAVSARGAR